MRILRIIILSLLVAGSPMLGWCAETAHEVAKGVAEASPAHEAGAKAEHGLTAHALEIWKIGPLPITNSMVVTWVVALGLIICVQLATRSMKQVPSGAQNFWEWLVESLHEFLDGIIGHELVHKTFWFFATVFIFILFCNWLGLLPGFGTIGYGEKGVHEFHVTEPWFRGANADMNMTLAISLMFFFFWTVWAIQAHGPFKFIMHLFAPKGETTGFLKALMVAVFLLVGVLEVVSILFRPISLSFRLFGNVFAGENMLEAMSTLVPGWLGAIIVPIPFYFLEVLVGIVQAMVFMLLTAVFTMLICEHDEEPGHAEGKH